MKKTILVVEDEKPMLEALHDKLEKVGFEVLTATDGAIGLELALEKNPDLILLDIIMPNMDGMVAMEKIRADDWGKEVPIIFLTNLGASDKILQKLIAHNHADFCIKAETKLVEIVEKVKKMLK